MNLLPRNLSRICDRTSTRMETMCFRGRSEINLKWQRLDKKGRASPALSNTRTRRADERSVIRRPIA
jgi:hypothetical protein